MRGIEYFLSYPFRGKTGGKFVNVASQWERYVALLSIHTPILARLLQAPSALPSIDSANDSNDSEECAVASLAEGIRKLILNNRMIENGGSPMTIRELVARVEATGEWHRIPVEECEPGEAPTFSFVHPERADNNRIVIVGFPDAQLGQIAVSRVLQVLLASGSET